MNSCILMARIVNGPELRFTSDGQTPVANVLLEFDALKPSDPPQRLKATGWRGLAEELNQNYQVGDQVIVQGSLRMDSFDRPEGFKEKRAELTISKIYKQAAGTSFQSLSEPAPSDYAYSEPAYSGGNSNYSGNNSGNNYAGSPYGDSARPDNVVPMENYSRPLSEPSPVAAPSQPPSQTPAPLSDDDLDNIPF